MSNSLILPCRRLIICYFVLQLSVFAQAEIDELTPQELVSQMYRATHELNYDGIFIYRYGRQMDTMRLIHKNDADGEMERLVSLTGHPREVIRNKNSVSCFFPDKKTVIVEKSRPYEIPVFHFPDGLVQIAKYYRFAFSGHDRIAGHNARIVSIQPFDNYRYGYQFWIGEESKLLLKSELKNESGYPLEQVVFTKLDVLESVPDDLLKPSLPVEGYTRYDNTVTFPVQNFNKIFWKISWAPEGFTLSKDEYQLVDNNGTEVKHMMYTDGVAMVSVFIEKIRTRSQFVTGSSKIGAINAYSRHADGYQVTAVGEVPLSTVEKMAISVIPDQ